MNRFLVILSFSLFLLSCNKEEDNILFVSESDFEEITLTSSKINKIDQLTPSTIHILDSLLVVTDYQENPRIHFYNKKNLNKIAQYGFIGEGPEEFNAPEWNGQFFIKNGSKDTYIRIYEFGYGILHDVNLSAILRGEESAKIKKHYLNPDIYNADNVFFDDLDVYGEATYSEGVKYFKTSLDDMATYQKMGVFNSDELLDKAGTIENRINLDRSFMDFSEDRDVFVAGYLRYNKIIILDNDLNEIKRLVWGKREKLPNSPDIFSEDNIFYYRKPYCGKDYFYVPFSGVPTGENRKSHEIHVFDYNGKPIFRYILEMPFDYFTIDEDEGMMYVLTGNDDKPYVSYNLNK